MANSNLDLLLLYEPRSSLEKQIVFILDRIVAAGLLDKDTLDRAKEEARSWYKDPCLSCGTLAFHFWTHVFAAGRV